MPMMNVVFDFPGPVIRTWRLFTSRILAAFGARSGNIYGRTAPHLQTWQAWSSSYSAPVNNLKELRAGFLNSLPELVPVPVSNATILVQHGRDKQSLKYAVVDNAVWTSPGGSPALNRVVVGGVVFRTKKAIDGERNTSLLGILAILSLFLLPAAVANFITTDLKAANELLANQEFTLRAELTRRARSAQQTTDLEALMESNLERLSPVSQLDWINRLSASYPPSAHWTYLNIAGETKVTALSGDAGEALATITQSLPDYNAALESDVETTADRKERFSLIVSEPER